MWHSGSYKGMEQREEAILVGKGNKVISRQAGLGEGFPGGRKDMRSDHSAWEGSSGSEEEKSGGGL